MNDEQPIPEIAPGATPIPPTAAEMVAQYRASAARAATEALANHYLNQGAAQAFAAVLELLKPKE